MKKLIVAIMVVVSLVFGGVAEAYVACGFYYSYKDNNIIIDYILKKSPAYRAGMKEGDIIVKVDGKTFKNEKKFHKLIRVKKPIIFTILRKKEIIEISVVREMLPEYTSCNIWVHKGMKCINYKMGNFIPAGTELSSARWYISGDEMTKRITIKIKSTNKKHILNFTGRWHPKYNVKKYINYFVGLLPFDELTRKLTEKEKEAIKQGKIIVGMSKEAVLICYGRPAEHKTPDLKSNKWIYWMNKKEQKVICFQNGLAIRCSDFEKLTDEI